MSFTLTDNAVEVADRLVNLFKGDAIPPALCNLFLRVDGSDATCHAWSWNNRLLMAEAGHIEARTFKQWKAVGRSVRKGETSFKIFAPLACKTKRENTETGETETKTFVKGFRVSCAFGYLQTDGEPLAHMEALDSLVENLPLRAVADSWGIDVRLIDGEFSLLFGRAGCMMSSDDRPRAIEMGVANLSTWCHELVHAADMKRGELKTEKRTDTESAEAEIVAEFGGAVLLTMIGLDHDADLGGCWSYVTRYATLLDCEPFQAITKLLDRTCGAVQLIVDTARELSADDREPAPEAEAVADTLEPVTIAADAFTLERAPAIVAKPKRIEGRSETTTQRVLFAGMDCLPGQMDLFPTDGN